MKQNFDFSSEESNPQKKGEKNKRDIT